MWSVEGKEMEKVEKAKDRKTEELTDRECCQAVWNPKIIHLHFVTVI